MGGGDSLRFGDCLLEILNPFRDACGAFPKNLSESQDGCACFRCELGGTLAPYYAIYYPCG